MEHRCPPDDEIQNGYNTKPTHNGWPGCPDAAWWWKYREFFRITGYYDLKELSDANGRPSFTKLAHDIQIYYNKDAQVGYQTNSRAYVT